MKISINGIILVRYGSISDRNCINGNVIIINRNEPMKAPCNANIEASYPLPSCKSWCPGRTERKVSSSGAPRNIEGIKSRKVCVIDSATMKSANASGGNEEMYEVFEIKNAAIRFIWIDGARPVNVPRRIPHSITIKYSIILFL